MVRGCREGPLTSRFARPSFRRVVPHTRLRKMSSHFADTRPAARGMSGPRRQSQRVPRTNSTITRPSATRGPRPASTRVECSDERCGQRRREDLRERGGEVPDAHRRRHRVARENRVRDRPVGGEERAPRHTRRDCRAERNRQRERRGERPDGERDSGAATLTTTRLSKRSAGRPASAAPTIPASVKAMKRAPGRRARVGDVQRLAHEEEQEAEERVEADVDRAARDQYRRDVAIDAQAGRARGRPARAAAGARR